MKKFDVFELQDGSYRAIKYGFNWPSFFFTWIWCFFVARLYGWGCVWIGVIFLGAVLGSVENQMVRSNPEGALLLSFVDIAAIIGFGIYFSYNANNFRRRKYIENGYTRLCEKIQAPNRDKAISIARQDNRGAKGDDVGLKQASTDKIPNVEDAQNTLEKSLEDLSALKAKNVLSDAEFEEAKKRAQEAHKNQEQLAEQLISEKEVRAEFDKSMNDLTALHQQGVLDNSAYESAKMRLFKELSEKGIECIDFHNGMVIEKRGDKFLVEGREYKSVDSAKAYIDHYKS